MGPGRGSVELVLRGETVPMKGARTASSRSRPGPSTATCTATASTGPGGSRPRVEVPARGRARAEHGRGPERFEWDDEGWRGRPWEETVLYELHVGTFSPEGTFTGAEARLDYLAGSG
nr:hypothetical protein [Rubrobacter marinus]